MGRETNVLCHDDGADHAGAQIALLIWGNEVFAHGEGGGCWVEGVC
jgi:predicted CxxxxCH...CXXCH cytochrome family protein